MHEPPNFFTYVLTLLIFVSYLQLGKIAIIYQQLTAVGGFNFPNRCVSTKNRSKQWIYLQNTTPATLKTTGTTIGWNISTLIPYRTNGSPIPVSYTHLRAHETDSYLVCRLLLEQKKK